ncbi:hypothetical protein U9M48_003496 [Paspalum notatum var. saurae]|uniref:Uncharacterized protein n=1 Tax=Paspalum notatum var. saurae TaxID=547442 RepID=A0AAQ3SGX8_PASNO
MASSVTSALSSMEVMLDALMQRGIGKPEEQKPKEQEPPALPTRPTGRGRLPSLHRPGAAAPWIQQPPLRSPMPPPQEEDVEKCLVNLELERRAVKAEEEVKQKEEEMRQKENLIATLRQQVEHYESCLSECEVRMKGVEEDLQKQVTSLQMAQAAGRKRGGSRTTSQHRQEPSRGNLLPSQSSARRKQRSCEAAVVVVDERTSEINQLVREFKRESEAFDHIARVMVEERPSPSGAKSVDELKTLKRQFTSWKKDYEARLKKTKAELMRLVYAEKKSQDHGHQRRCGWWRIKALKCRTPKCSFNFKLPSPKSCCCCCFRRC